MIDNNFRLEFTSYANWNEERGTKRIYFDDAELLGLNIDIIIEVYIFDIR